LKISDKLVLIDKIGRTLQAKFGYSEIDLFLAEFGISPPQNWQGSNSKWLYSKAALSGIKEDILLKISQELQIESIVGNTHFSTPPKNWKDTTRFRLFISHLSKDKDKATRLRDCLINYSISSFVAHEDILPTQAWMDEIERGLFTMDAFLAIHTKGFKDSYWTQQEVGFAVARGIKVISLRMGEDPYGFISKHQALSRNRKSAEEISDQIYNLLLDDDRTKNKIVKSLSEIKAPDDEVLF
jgi:TIR domain